MANNGSDIPKSNNSGKNNRRKNSRNNAKNNNGANSARKNGNLDNLKSRIELSAEVDKFSARVNLFEKVERQVAQLKSVVILLLVSVMCLFVFGLYHRLTHLNTIEIKRQALVKVNTAAPAISRYLGQMGRRLLPIYTVAITAKAEEKYPSFIEQATKETDALVAYVNSYTKEKIIARLMDILTNQGAYIMARFPELRDETACMELAQNVQTILTRALSDVAVDKVGAHLDAIANIQARLKELKAQTAATPETNVEFKLMAVTFELIGEKLAQEVQALEGGQKL